MDAGRSPISRSITDEVPAWYMPQLQVLMHVLNLVSPQPLHEDPRDSDTPHKEHSNRERQNFEDGLLRQVFQGHGLRKCIGQQGAQCHVGGRLDVV